MEDQIAIGMSGKNLREEPARPVPADRLLAGVARHLPRLYGCVTREKVCEPPRRQGRQEWGVLEPSAELDELAHRVIGAAIEVHRLLGPGFFHLAQILSYLKATRFRLGLLINVGVDVLSVASSVSSEAHNLALLAPWRLVLPLQTLHYTRDRLRGSPIFRGLQV